MTNLIHHLTFTAGSLLTLLQFTLLIAASGFWAVRKFSDSTTATRNMAAAIAVFWLSGFIFLVLIPLGQFNRTATTIFLSLAAALSWYTWARHQPRLLENHIHETLSDLTSLWARLPRLTKFLSLAVLVVFLIRFCRGLVAPPLAWDALTYHLLKAGRWVQSGGWVWEQAPDSWQFYEYFPPLGDVYFAWAMLGTHTDAWLTPLGGAIWIICLLATYALARSLDIEKHLAWLAMLIMGSVPAVMAFITANYVDNTAYALVTIGSALLIHGVKLRHLPSLATSSIAMALAVGIKITFLPYLLVALTLFTWFALRPLQLRSLAATYALTLISLAWQITLIILGKTPFYPAPLSIAGWEIEKGQPEFLKHHFEVDFWLPYMWEMPQSLWKFMYIDEPHVPGHLNLTLAFPFVLLFGLLGFYAIIKRSSGSARIAIGGLFVAGLAIFYSFWSPSAAFYRGLWIDNMGRFFSPWYTLLVLSLPGIFRRYTSRVYAVLIIICVISAWPKAWISLDIIATAIGLAILTLGLVSLTKLFSPRPAYRIVSLLAIMVLLPLWSYTRSHARYPFYSATKKVYDVIIPGLLPFPAGSAQWLDGRENVTINLSIDYQLNVNRWFRYIFLGSRLQNTVVYIPPTDDGSVWSKSVTTHKDLNFEKWRERMLEQQVDYYVSATPYPEEAMWAWNNAGFEQLPGDPHGKWILLSIPSTKNENYN